MPLVTTDFFVGEINIPNTSDLAVAERLNFFIIKHEEKLLRMLLGDGLYNAMVAGLALTTPDPDMVKLRDGVSYTDLNGVARHWMGLANSNKLQSLIANYVYYWWSRDKASHSSVIGEVSPATDGADKVSPMAKQVRAWNEMVEWNYQLIDYLDSSTETYTDWDRDNWLTYYPSHLFSPINTFNL